MSTEPLINESIAILIARVFLGLLFLFQGADAIFGIGLKGVVQTIEQPLAAKGVPRFFIRVGAYYTSLAELLGGILLVCGIFTPYALYLLGLDLLIASVAFGLIKPMWDMQFVFPRLALLLFLLIAPR